jgi:hypothetical protein
MSTKILPGVKERPAGKAAGSITDEVVGFFPIDLTLPGVDSK